MSLSPAYTSDRSVLKFFSRSKDASVRILSNFSKHRVSVSGFSYASGEHAFQSEKFLRLANDATAERSRVLTAQSDKVKLAEGPLEAKRCGGKSKAKGLLLTTEEQKKWGKVSMIVQAEICKYKFNNYPECRELLEQHPTHYLLHQENRGKEPVWGGRIKDGALVGKNKLGVVWMKARRMNKKKTATSSYARPRSGPEAGREMIPGISTWPGYILFKKKRDGMRCRMNSFTGESEMFDVGATETKTAEVLCSF